MTGLDRHYTDPALTALYDIESGWSEDRDFYLNLAGKAPVRVLDLGCGTGLLCHAWAGNGHLVTGVDPAAAMLAEARRQRPDGQVQWVQATAQTFRSDARFDLIVMTGHALQVLTEVEDLRAGFATMKRHLAPGGLVAFESRNPALDWPSIWSGDVWIETPEGRLRIERRIVWARDDKICFETTYHLRDGPGISRSTLWFPSRAVIEAELKAQGLKVDRLCGDWQHGAFDPAISREMVFLVRLAG